MPSLFSENSMAVSGCRNPHRDAICVRGLALWNDGECGSLQCALRHVDYAGIRRCRNANSADEFTLGGLVVGMVFAAFVPVPDSTFRALAGLSGFTNMSWRTISLGEAALGVILPAGSLWFGGWLFQKIRHKDGLGFGDVKMMAMVGAFLGVRGTLLTLIVGSLLGSVIGIIYIKATKQEMSSYELPFGTFLAAAAMAVALVGGPVIDWYANQL